MDRASRAAGPRRGQGSRVCGAFFSWCLFLVSCYFGGAHDTEGTFDLVPGFCFRCLWFGLCLDPFPFRLPHLRVRVPYVCGGCYSAGFVGTHSFGGLSWAGTGLIDIRHRGAWLLAALNGLDGLCGGLRGRWDVVKVEGQLGCLNRNNYYLASAIVKGYEVRWDGHRKTTGPVFVRGVERTRC